jgi:hypothetical protein
MGGGIVFTVISIILPLIVYPVVDGRYTAQGIIVRAPAGLAVYQQIGPSDIGLQKKAGGPNAFRLTGEVVGRFATRPCKQGDLIEKGSLSKGDPSLAWSDFQTIGVQVKPFAKADFTVLPRNVPIRGIPKPNVALGNFSLEAILLAADDSKEATVRLALKTQDLDILQAALSQFDLYLAEPLP